MWSVVTESPSTASTRAPAMSGRRRRRGRQPVEERRPADVGRLAPVVAVAARAPRASASARRRRRPRRSCGGTCPTAPPARPSSAISLARGPDVAQVHRLRRRGPRRAGRVARSMSIVPGERVGDDERRRGEVVHLDLGLDAPLEVAVAREHRDDGEVALARRRARPPRAAGPSCRCRSCSRSRRGGSRAPRAAR